MDTSTASPTSFTKAQSSSSTPKECGGKIKMKIVGNTGTIPFGLIIVVLLVGSQPAGSQPPHYHLPFDTLEFP